MKKTRRTGKVGDLLRQEISEIIRRDLDDTSLAFVSITGVEVAPDLRYARVHVSALGAAADIEQAVKSLQKGRARIRHLLGQRISLRNTPDLEFQADLTTINANRIEQILREVIPEERESDDDRTD